MNSTHDYTAVIIETKSGFIGIVLDVPGAFSQAKSEEVLIERLKDAVGCIFEANKASSKITWNEILPMSSAGIPKSNNNFDRTSKSISIPCY